jgi:hypothetical protein
MVLIPLFFIVFSAANQIAYCVVHNHCIVTGDSGQQTLIKVKQGSMLHGGENKVFTPKTVIAL